MSKYETTNAQFAEFLNSAMNDGLIKVQSGSYVYASDDASLLRLYCVLSPAQSSSQITYTNGVFTVRTRDGRSMNNHPVVRVTWHGATAFCDYYNYRLPTEWEWQAAADYDGSYIYGCGTTINSSKANYGGYNPLGMTTSPYTSPVGYFSDFGYGLCDMAGNVNEWTSTDVNGNRVLRGGSWNLSVVLCEVSHRSMIYPPNSTGPCMGFRVCR
jgi:formylglycine-generating enzyme required for sulfatase activity